MYICLCKGVTESDVRTLGRAGVVSPEALAATLGIDREGCCGRCLQSIAEIAALATAERLKAAVKAPAGFPAS